MIKASPRFVAVAVLGLSASTPSVSAFVGSRPAAASASRRPSHLHATYAFQRALLAERLGAAKDPDLPPSSPPPPLPDAAEEGGATTTTTTSGAVARRSGDDERFHRALLEAKLACDAAGAAPTAVGDVAAGEEAAPPSEGAAALVVAEPEPGAELAEAVVGPEPTAVVAAVAEPEPAAEPLAEPEPTAAVAAAVAAAEPEPISEPVSVSAPTATVDVAVVVAAAEPVAQPDAAKPELVAESVAESTAAVAPSVAKPELEPVAEPVLRSVVVRTTEFTVPRELAIVPINEASVQFAAGALGGAIGLVLGGPILGAVAASACNYLSRKEDERSYSTSTNRETITAKRVIDNAAQTALLAYNFVSQFDRDNKILDSVLRLLERAVDKVKGTDSPAVDAIVALESTLGGIANRVEEWNDDYDLLWGAGTVLDSVGDLVEIGVDKVVELNGEYKLTDRAMGVVKGAVGMVTEK